MGWRGVVPLPNRPLGTGFVLARAYLAAALAGGQRSALRIHGFHIVRGLGLDRGTQGLCFLQELEWPPRREAPFVPRCRTSLALLTCLVGVLRAARAVPSRGDENFL